MTTDHITRWNGMDDKTFIEHARYYRRFNNVTKVEHDINLDYLVNRLDSLGYDLQQGCCNRNYVTKKN